MLTYNQRYRPRTTREYTKSDLTVYDSAGNTALNALTVYGKSEVVDGVIKSAGEGWATVDLGTLTWKYYAQYNTFVSDSITDKSPVDRTDYSKGILCDKYPSYDAWWTDNTKPNKSISCTTNVGIAIKDTDYTDQTDFKSAMSGVLLCYQLADPTQGNTIAVKADDGSGINGTMAVFSTGTPLRGIPDSNVRDVMAWDGSSGEVTKNCGKVRLADLAWNYNTSSSLSPFFYVYTQLLSSGNIKYRGEFSTTLYNVICPAYPTVKRNGTEFINKTLTIDGGSGTVTQLQIKDTDYTTVEAFIASLGDAELVYELATPTTEQLTTTENDSIASLRTFDGTTHFTNNASTDMTANYTMRVPTIS